MSDARPSGELGVLADTRLWTAIAVATSVLLVLVAFLVLDGTARWLLAGIAVLDLVVTPVVTRRTFERAAGRDR